MQENRDDVSDRSQVSGSGPGDSSSAFLHNSKLRNKLEKLARWRIDPSLIDFPQDALEFRGGFATVSQGLLASSSHAGAGANEAEQTTDEHPSPEDGNPQSDSDIPDPGDDHQGKDEKADSHTADGDNDQGHHTTAEERQDNGAEQKPQTHNPTSIGDRSALSEHTVDDDPDLGNRNAQPPKKDEGTGSLIADGDDDQTQEEGRQQSESTKEERNSDDQTAKPKIVAVKKIKIEGDTDLERALGLAIRESGFLVELSHPNIVKIEGFIEDLSTRKVWLIFPWEEHGNLRDFLASGEWEIPERISLVHDVTLGLEYLHSQEPPIYHGDLKSLNIFVDSECNALITDFGSARHLEDDHAGRQPKENHHKTPPASDPTANEEQITLEAIFSATASTLTLTGSGYTLRWAAPELLQDEEPCLRSDIWALGWIAYEVMTNTIPFHDVKKDAIVINHVIQGHLPSVTEHARMSLIRALCSLMVRCWSINPDKRPTAEECRKWISWMPMIVPAPVRIVDEESSQLRHAQVLNQLGKMYRAQADYVSAISCLIEALNIYTTKNDSRGRAATLINIADVHRFRGEYDEAVTLYSEALQISTDLGDESDRGTGIFGLAEIHRLRDEYGEAVKLYSEYLQISTKTGSKRDRANALSGLGEVHQLQAEYSEATNLYSEALQVYTDVGDRRETAMTLWCLAEVHRFQNEYSEAINLYSEALQIFTDVGDHKQRALTLWSLGEVHRFQQEYSEARKLFSESLKVYTDIGDTTGRGAALWGLAEVHRGLYEYDEATKLYSEAMQIFVDVGDKYWRARTLKSRAETNQMQGHSREAISLYTEASEVWEEMGDSRRASNALGNAADIRKTLREATTDSAETVKVGEEPLLTSG